MNPLAEQIKDLHTVAIYGNTGSGKTALAYTLLSELKKYRPVYFLCHPNPKLLLTLGYKNLNTISELELVSDCIVYWDEPQLMNLSQFKKEEVMVKVMSLARQRNILLIFSTSETRTFSARVEAYIQLWFIKDVEYVMTKQRSMIREIIKNNTFIDPRGFNLNKNEVIAYSRQMKVNGRFSFELIPEWNEQLSKPYNLQ